MAVTVLALDVGEARIGLATGQVGSSFAFGRGYLKRSKQAEDVAAILEKMAQENAELLVIGLPTRTDGKDSPQTRRVRSFAKALEVAGAKIVFEDERFTTRAATQGISSSGASKKKRRDKGRVDEASAILILETYLTRHNNSQRL